MMMLMEAFQSICSLQSSYGGIPERSFRFKSQLQSSRSFFCSSIRYLILCSKFVYLINQELRASVIVRHVAQAISNILSKINESTKNLKELLFLVQFLLTSYYSMSTYDPSVSTDDDLIGIDIMLLEKMKGQEIVTTLVQILKIPREKRNNEVYNL